jgi:glutathione peroxidase
MLILKNKLLIVICACLSVTFINCFTSAERPEENMKSSKSIYNYSFISIDGQKIDLKDFKGKKLLLVNVASECCFTPQYEGLENLNKSYNDRLVIIGFPANNFGGQEPGTNEEIEQFCKMNYGVSFLLAQKSDVKGKNQNEIFKWLTDKSLNGWNDIKPKWNFYKFFINEEGELIKVFPSTTKPMSEEIIKLL